MDKYLSGLLFLSLLVTAVAGVKIYTTRDIHIGGARAQAAGESQDLAVGGKAQSQGEYVLERRPVPKEVFHLRSKRLPQPKQQSKAME